MYYVFALVALFSFGFAFPTVLAVAKIAFVAFIVLVVVDVYWLFGINWTLKFERIVDDKLSNGDNNLVRYLVSGLLPFKSKLVLIDEFPVQLQLRERRIQSDRNSLEFEIQIEEYIKPLSRGEYAFGKSHVLVFTPLNLVSKQVTFDNERVCKVYPSFMQYKKYVFLALNNRLKEVGVKKIRQLGGVTEFEQIKEYVRGDDYRRINWKATARKESLMVNHYDDEKAQNIYLLIDKGRMMQMPFNGMALFDYAINSALVMAGIALRKGDKAGLITFSNLIGTFLDANHGKTQINNITEELYKQQNRNKETDYLRLLKNVRTRIKRRSLFMLFTNFESSVSLERQMPYLKALAKYHVLILILFENKEVVELANSKVNGNKEFFDQALAEKQVLEKEGMAIELKKEGIYSIITAPEELSLNTINKYLELKSKGVI